MKNKTVNKIKRREKKHNKHRMIVDDSGRKLAMMKRVRYLNNLTMKNPVVSVETLKKMVQQGRLHQKDLDEYLAR